MVSCFSLFRHNKNSKNLFQSQMKTHLRLVAAIYSSYLLLTVWLLGATASNSPAKCGFKEEHPEELDSFCSYFFQYPLAGLNRPNSIWFPCIVTLWSLLQPSLEINLWITFFKAVCPDPFISPTVQFLSNLWEIKDFTDAEKRSEAQT